ncbi:hypothetical protein FSP39_010572 [Pinctada imbricata]|uniref:B box-type domain-containing protein n=1 Tax=Pinctada imbricata TaxID=66713 RepID=A0AA88YM99_PINIB|nr:hypothetical protein FSP39_010572 [Pinctada imbricata]
MPKTKISDKNCDVCTNLGRSSEKTKVHFMCHECRELYCETCAKLHIKFKCTSTHSLLDLLSPDKNKLPDVVKMGENGQILYLRKMKITNRMDFSVYRPEDTKEVCVTGIILLFGRIVVVDNGNKVFKLFDIIGTYVSSAPLKEVTRGITLMGHVEFATCGGGNRIILWSVDGDKLYGGGKYYYVDHEAHAIHFNDSYFFVLHRDDQMISVLDDDGTHIRKIVVKEALGKQISLSAGIYASKQNHEIYVLCTKESRGVLAISFEGEAQWHLPLTGYLGDIKEANKRLLVSNVTEHCIHMITKEGEFIENLMEEKELGEYPNELHFAQRAKLFVSYTVDEDKVYRIAIFSAFETDELFINDEETTAD